MAKKKDALRELQDSIGSLGETVMRIKAQRDELLSAAKKVRAALGKRAFGTANPGEVPAFLALCEAINAAEEASK